jgi:hypothetical protein
MEETMRGRLISLFILATLFLAACTAAEPVAEPVVSEATMTESSMVVAATPTANNTTVEEAAISEVSFSKDVWPIIEQYALAAHGGKGGVFLENYDDIMKYVTPGDPENSRLYKDLIGDGVKRMPPDAPLADNLIQTIYDWIKQGAKNN